MPSTLGFREAATLTCSGLTAWNALFGPGLASARTREFTNALEGKHVLVQGSGGVSVVALQVCVVPYFILFLCCINLRTEPGRRY